MVARFVLVRVWAYVAGAVASELYNGDCVSALGRRAIRVVGTQKISKDVTVSVRSVV